MRITFHCPASKNKKAHQGEKQRAAESSAATSVFPSTPRGEQRPKMCTKQFSQTAWNRQQLWELHPHSVPYNTDISNCENPSPWIQTLHRGNYALRRGEGLFKTDWTYLNQTWITKPNFKNLTAANGNKTIPPYYFCQHNKVIFRIKKKKEKLFTAVKTQLRSIYK